MKIKLLILILLSSFTAFAQSTYYDSTKQLQVVNAYGNDVKNQQVRGALILPRDTFKLAVKDSGSIAFKANTLWNWNGYVWIKTSVTGGPSTTVTYYGVNGTGDSTILTLSNGVRYAAVLSSTATINTTYSGLLSLIAGNNLIEGRIYRISDFATKYKLLTTNEPDRDSIGDLEPLFVTAKTNNTISYLAFSEQYPEDIIHYSLYDTSPLAPLGSTLGKILYRNDTKNNLSAYYDFRNIVWQRCEVTSGGPFIAFYNNTGVYNFVKTFGSNNKDISLGEGSINATFSSGCYDITVGKRLGGPGTGLFVGSSCHSINIASDCAAVQTYGSGYIGGIYIGSSSRNINIGSRSYNIAIGQNNYAIELGLQNSDISIPPNLIRKRLEKGFSNFEVSTTISAKKIDLFNITTAALSPFLYNSANYCGIVKVTGAAVDTLDNLTALTTSVTVQDIRIQPDSGVKILIRDTSFNTTAGKSFVLGNNLLLDGSKGEYAQFHKNIINGQTAQPAYFYLSYTNKISSGGGGSTYTLSKNATRDSIILTDAGGNKSVVKDNSIFTASGSQVPSLVTDTLGTKRLSFDITSVAGTNTKFDINNTDDNVYLKTNQNSTTRFVSENINDGNFASGGFVARNQFYDQMVLQTTSSTFSAGGTPQRTGVLHSNANGGLQLAAARVNTGLYFGVGLGGTRLDAFANTATVPGTSGNWIFQTGTFTPTDNGAKVQVVGKMTVSDIVKFSKYKNNVALDSIAAFDTAGNLVQVLKPTGGGTTDTTSLSNRINSNTSQGIANAAAIQQRIDSLRNNAGVLEARKGGVFVPQFTLPSGGTTYTATAPITLTGSAFGISANAVSKWTTSSSDIYNNNTGMVQVLSNTNSDKMTLNSKTGVAFGILSAGRDYGLHAGVSNSGGTWLQSGRNSGGAVAYDLSLQASGGNLIVGRQSALYGVKMEVAGAFTSEAPSSSTKMTLGSISNIAFAAGSPGAITSLYSGSSSTVGGSWLQSAGGAGDARAFNLSVQAAGGNFGVGEESPTEKLHVNGNSIVTGNAKVGAGTNASAKFEVVSNTQGSIPAPLNDFRFVGSNITSPTKGLHATDSSSGRMIYYDGTTWNRYDDPQLSPYSISSYNQPASFTPSVTAGLFLEVQDGNGASMTINTTPINTNGMMFAIYNGEQTDTVTFTGSTVYQLNGTTVITTIPTGSYWEFRRIGGKIRKIN